ncbi:MAG: UDP-N-acetylglucosamine 1-carboxyvinyltransferase [Lachnospiraceae bacterium]|nr:UDP-N-acetylglucosamine 1-carboxyvinyltransferase [Lachnospiraceae bacterium]
MDKSYILIRGGQKLSGEIILQGSKNSALPILASCLLCRGISVIEHCPRIHDIFMMTAVMEQIGCKISWQGHALLVDTRQITATVLPMEYTGNFRASVLLMGALLSREGCVSMGKPGGCKIGSRPIDFHLAGFHRLGADVKEKEERYFCQAKQLSGADICLPFPSVGATENILLASVTAKGVTRIFGCAKEPEISDLAKHLVRMGARINGIGTNEMIIEGVGAECLHTVETRIPADRIAAATYLIGAAAVKGDIELLGCGEIERYRSILCVLDQMGAKIWIKDGRIRLKMEQQGKGVRLITGPHPMVPTDIQSMVLSASLLASGKTYIEENIFESRYQVVGELEKMGGCICVEGKRAVVTPVQRLSGCKVNVGDLRGGAALVIAGMMAEGETRVESLSYLRRGYEDIAGDFRRLGAHILEIDNG